MDKTLDLDELERVAREATPGEWVSFDRDTASNIYSAGNNGSLLAVCHSYTTDISEKRPNAARRKANATYIATFDPPTVLTLIAAARPAVVSDDVVEKGWLPLVLCPTDGVDRALLLPDGREVMGAYHNPGGWQVHGEPIEYEVPVYGPSGGFIPDGQVRRAPDLKQTGTTTRTMHVVGKLPDGVYPTHFRPNDTVYGAAMLSASPEVK